MIKRYRLLFEALMCGLGCVAAVITFEGRLSPWVLLALVACLSSGSNPLRKKLGANAVQWRRSDGWVVFLSLCATALLVIACLKFGNTVMFPVIIAGFAASGLCALLQFAGFPGSPHTPSSTDRRVRKPLSFTE